MYQIGVFHLVAVGFMCLALGLTFGFMWGDLHAEKEREAKEKQLEQQKMWNEYISALKEGKNGR